MQFGGFDKGTKSRAHVAQGECADMSQHNALIEDLLLRKRLQLEYHIPREETMG